MASMGKDGFQNRLSYQMLQTIIYDNMTDNIHT